MGLLKWSFGDVFYLDAVTVIYSVENVEPSILDQAARVRAMSKIHTPDSIHAATAQTLNCTTFLTNDKGLLRVQNLPVRLLSEVAAA